MADSPRARVEVEAAMRRIHDLSTSEQLKVFLLLRDYLANTVGEETAADKQIRERAEALDAMQKVAEYLGLPPGVTAEDHTVVDHRGPGGCGFSGRVRGSNGDGVGKLT